MADATKSAANPNGQDVVYWIAPENGAKKAATPHVFHICQGVSPLRGKTVNQRLGDRGLCGERDPHHQADPDGAEAVRVRRQRTRPPPRRRDNVNLPSRRSGALLAADVDADEASGELPRLTSSSTLERPALRAASTPAITCAGWSPAGC